MSSLGTLLLASSCLCGNVQNDVGPEVFVCCGGPCCQGGHPWPLLLFLSRCLGPGSTGICPRLLQRWGREGFGLVVSVFDLLSSCQLGPVSSTVPLLFSSLGTAWAWGGLKVPGKHPSSSGRVSFLGRRICVLASLLVLRVCPWSTWTDLGLA